MSNPTAGQGSLISQHLRATKKLLTDVIFDAEIMATLDAAEVDILKRDAFEIVRLICVWRNTFAPINKIPPEILALIPDFWSTHEKDQDIIALTHVCRAWREVFVSRSSLWTHFDCVSGEKTRVYLERSESSPIKLSLCGRMGLYPHDSFFQIIPHATGRLKSLFIDGAPEGVRIVTSHLSHPAPLLNHLSIRCNGDGPRLDLAPALLGGDLSSLRTLRLEFIRTDLPWRNMVNLTSFTLFPTGAVSVGQFLDFFESAPYLEEVKLCSRTPTSGSQNGRLVSLACLKSMCIEGGGSLFDHLLIPVGTKLEIWVDLPSSPIREHLPRSLDNFKNLSDFTTIKLHPGKYYPRMTFSGPNGLVNMILKTFRDNRTDLVLESLGEFDTSKTERFEIDGGDFLCEELLYQALLPMKDLRTLTLFGCNTPQPFIRALQPTTSSSEATICPKLEELVLVLCLHEKVPYIASLIKMAAARALRGEKLRTIRIVEEQGKADLDVSGLKKHVWNVEYGPGVGL